ncbi:MAG: hypothetical protein AAGN35_23660 [Bacteroidota bacterium]
MKHLLTYFLLLAASTAMAQDTLVKKSPLQGFNISGNYRFYAQHRYFTDPYAIDVVNDQPTFLTTRSILLGDASQLPELTLNISGKPSAKTSFGTDLVVWNQNNGNFDYYRNLQLGINLYGSFTTDFGTVDVKAGGIHWHKMTPFTMQAFAGYNRFSIFDRNPWDPQFNEIDRRYSEYHELGAITQDERWGSQAFQGFLMNVSQLPGNFSLEFMYGKTQNATAAFNDGINGDLDSTNNAFFGFFQNTIPNNVIGGRLTKNFGKHRVTLNTFNRRTYSDILATDPILNNVHTADFNFDFDQVRVSGEIGAGRYQDISNDPGFGEMASLKINFDKRLTKIPFELHAFRISPNAVNANGEFVNTSIIEATSATSGSNTIVGANGVLQQTGSAMLAIGQMANNRQGINLNFDLEPTEDLIITVGNGIATELENINNKVTYGHAINGLTMSRFWRFFFPSNVGPYGRVSVLFRGVFETVNLTDLSSNGTVVNDKYFNNIETQIKYKFDLFERPWYIFYLGMYNSIQPQFSPITVFNEDAYIRYYAHQLESYYRIHPKLVLAQYLGWERVIGNYATQINIETERPLNQEGFALGGGFDYMMSKNTALYFRHRYFRFEDTSFRLAKFAGHESTLELKIFF